MVAIEIRRRPVLGLVDADIGVAYFVGDRASARRFLMGFCPHYSIPTGWSGWGWRGHMAPRGAEGQWVAGVWRHEEKED